LLSAKFQQAATVQDFLYIQSCQAEVDQSEVLCHGGGGGNDQPITEIRPNFNYNIDPSLIDPRLNFKNIAAIIYLQEFLDKQAKGEDVDLEADINFRDQLGNLVFWNLVGVVICWCNILFFNQVLLV
jgi:hypothetical protein